MKKRFNFSKLTFAAAAVCLAAATGANAHDHNDNDDLGPFTVGEQGVFYAGGTYDVTPSPGAPTTMSNQSLRLLSNAGFAQQPLVELEASGRVPIIMIHGSQQTGRQFPRHARWPAWLGGLLSQARLAGLRHRSTRARQVGILPQCLWSAGREPEPDDRQADVHRA